MDRCCPPYVLDDDSSLCGVAERWLHADFTIQDITFSSVSSRILILASSCFDSLSTRASKESIFLKHLGTITLLSSLTLAQKFNDSQCKIAVGEVCTRGVPLLFRPFDYLFFRRLYVTNNQVLTNPLGLVF